MKHPLWSIRKVKEGSRNVWKVQFPKGIATFNTYREASKVQKAFSESSSLTFDESVSLCKACRG